MEEHKALKYRDYCDKLYMIIGTKNLDDTHPYTLNIVEPIWPMLQNIKNSDWLTSALQYFYFLRLQISVCIITKRYQN